MAEARRPEPCGEFPDALARPRLRLLGGFDLDIGTTSAPIPIGGQRLVALLALTGRWLTRVRAAGILWPDRHDTRALANLRATLWRMPPEARAVIATSGSRLQLSPAVTCDLSQFDRLVRAAIADETPAPGHDTVRLLSCDLLPDWYEDWVLTERQRLLQLRVHALEALCRSLAAAGRHAEAVDAGMAAVAVEPLWEGAQRALAEAYLADGNPGGALRRYLAYEALMLAELGISPTKEFRRLVGR
jgi:DNA-binding SARP family transcriptional activator